MNQAFIQPVQDVLSFNAPGDGSARALAKVGEKGWERGLNWLDRSGLTLYFWRQIRQRDMSSAVPRPIREEFERRRALNTDRTQVMVQEWKKLHNLFTSSGVRCVVLKGLATVPDYCPDPALRVQFDHDWLIERNSLGRAEELLRTAGYTRKPIRERDRAVYVPNTPAAGRAWDPLQAYAAELSRPVELHLELWDPAGEKISLQFPDDCMMRSAERTWDGQVFAALSDEDALLFEVTHAFRHIIHNWCRLSVLYEIAQFLQRRREDRAFWETLLCRIERNFPLQQALGVVLSLTATLFGPADYLAFLPAGLWPLSPNLRLWVDRFGTRSALNNFSKDKFSLFLLREFVTDKQAWRALRRRRLFPFQMLPRLRAEEGKAELSAPDASRRKKIHRLRRVGFHLRTAFRYACELPQWHYLTWREERRRRAHEQISRTAGRLANPSCECTGPVIEHKGIQFRSVKSD